MKSPVLIFACILVFYAHSLSAQEMKTITLPRPQIDIGKPLMQALNERKSTREFSPRTLPLQELSNLLWAACGVNRPDQGNRRTAPTAMNCQEIDVYVALENGLYLYNAPDHVLEQVLPEDIRAATGRQDFVAHAPLNLVFVSDYAKFRKSPPEVKDFYSATDTGFVSQNVYLYCASQGLATVVRNLVDKPELEKVMKLRTDQKVILTQTVGYPED